MTSMFRETHPCVGRTVLWSVLRSGLARSNAHSSWKFASADVTSNSRRQTLKTLGLHATHISRVRRRRSFSSQLPALPLIVPLLPAPITTRSFPPTASHNVPAAPAPLLWRPRPPRAVLRTYIRVLSWRSLIDQILHPPDPVAKHGDAGLLRSAD